MTDEDHTAARDFFSAYFHEDWALDAKSTEEVVQLYLANAPSADELNSVAQGIDCLLARWPTERMLEQALVNELGCYYLPRTAGRSAREWLQDIGLVLRSRARELAPDIG